MTSVYFYKGDHAMPLPSEIQAAADELGCTVTALKAVIATEASGRWYNADNSLIRRFEPHHLPHALQLHVGFSGNWRTSLGLSRSQRARMFNAAHRKNPEAAVRAASWGAFQIMGFNYARCGFASAVEMVRAFERDVQHQLYAFIRFVRHVGADSALRAMDWHEFGRIYNGSGQPAVYAQKVESHYSRITGRGSPTVLRISSRGGSVREMQESLSALGYDVRVDGFFGPETQDAVKAFQKDHDLAVDGLVGAMTWRALRKAVEEKAGTATNVPSMPTPEVKDTRGEDLMDKMGKGTGILGAISSFFQTMMGPDPSDVVRVSGILVSVALIGGGVGLILWSRQRHKSRRREAV